MREDAGMKRWICACLVILMILTETCAFAQRQVPSFREYAGDLVWDDDDTPHKETSRTKRRFYESDSDQLFGVLEDFVILLTNQYDFKIKVFFVPATEKGFRKIYALESAKSEDATNFTVYNSTEDWEIADCSIMLEFKEYGNEREVEYWVNNEYEIVDMGDRAEQSEEISKPTAKPAGKITPKPTAKPAGKITPRPTVKPTKKPTAKPVSCSSCGGDGKVSRSCSSCGGDGSKESRCSSCGGDGKKDCMSCHGKGKYDCGGCNNGTSRCGSCSGTGKRSGGKRCSTCGGDGRKTCSSCSGTGSRKCTGCSGKGDKRCSSCSGTGDKKSSCSTCGGDGRVNSTCSACGGDGKR